MNTTLLIGLWRQRLASPIRAVILALMLLLPPAGIALIRGLGLSTLGDGFPLTLVFAVGMIGQDVSSGVLQLILARPVRRSDYVLTRWLAVGLGASAASVAQTLLAWAAMATHDLAPTLGVIAQFTLGRELEIFGLAATMALLSCLIGGVGDLALFALVSVLGGLLGLIGQFRHSDLLIALSHELGALTSPRIEMAQLASGHPSWFAIATYASNLTLCLLVAIVVMNRKELSYASGG